MVLYAGQNCAEIGERWSNISLYAGPDMPDGMSIRIVDDVCDLIALKERWDQLSADSPGGSELSFASLLESWRKFRPDRSRSLHVLLVYSSGRIIGGIPMSAKYESAAGIIIRRTLRLMKMGAVISSSGSFVRANIRQYTPDILATTENKPAVMKALASYIENTSEYWDSVEFEYTTYDGPLVTDLLSLLHSETLDILVESVPQTGAGVFNHRQSAYTGVLAPMLDPGRQFHGARNDEKRKREEIEKWRMKFELNSRPARTGGACRVTIRRRGRGSRALVTAGNSVESLARLLRALPGRAVVETLRPFLTEWLHPVASITGSITGMFSGLRRFLTAPRTSSVSGMWKIMSVQGRSKPGGAVRRMDSTRETPPHRMQLLYGEIKIKEVKR